MGGKRLGLSRLWEKLVDRYPALEWVERAVVWLFLLLLISPLLAKAWHWVSAHWLN